MTEHYEVMPPERPRDDREVITAPIITAEEAYDRIVEDAVGRAMQQLPGATPEDREWMTGAAVVSLRMIETVQWSPVSILAERDPEDAHILTGLPPEWKKATVAKQWFIMRTPVIPPELATVTRDYAYFAALAWAAGRLETLQDALIVGLAKTDPFTRRALERYATFMQA